MRRRGGVKRGRAAHGALPSETEIAMKVGLVDTHAHLCAPVFEADFEAVLERARSAGIGAVTPVGETLAHAHRKLELSARHPTLPPGGVETAGLR